MSRHRHKTNTPDSDAGLTRREFLTTSVVVAASATLAGSFILGFSTDVEAQSTKPEINAWVVVQPDESVIIRIVRSEMGQGTHTGLAQLVAEELEADWSRVSLEFPTPGESLARKRVWGAFVTSASRGIRTSQEYVRKGGAAARMMLIQAAADQWKVPASECRVKDGVITHAATNKRTTYGKVTAAAAKLTPPKDPPLKDPKDWTLSGKRLARLDTAEKVNGSLKYSIDYTMDGQLNAAIRDCPVFGGKVKTFDATKVSSMPGVKKVVAVGDSAVAVVADTWWRAKKAVDALPIEYDLGPNAKVQESTIKAMLSEGLSSKENVFLGNGKGDVPAALASSSRRIEAEYSYPFQAHVAMEPLNATARWTPERCEVWSSTQNGEAALSATAEAAGLKPEQCEVYNRPLGGGFGRRGMTDYIRQAVAIARTMPGTPIKLLWSREEDMTHDYYHPVMMCKMSAGLDENDNINGFHMRLSGQSIMSAIFPQWLKEDGTDPIVFQGLNKDLVGDAMLGYNFPNLLVDHAMRNPHIPPGFWRGVNMNQNAIFLEGFIDEIADTTGKDPLALRRELLKNSPKHLAVLNAVAERVDWGTPPPDINGQKVFRGLSVTHGFGSYVAACAEVSVSDSGELKMHRIIAATDPGHVVNPQQVEAQIEGSFVYGLGAALFSECTVKDGGIEQTNFHNYPMVRMNHMPKVESIIMPSGGFWGGVGEPTIAVAAPAVLNAIFAATGKRIRNLPLGKQLTG
nr:molybdopterin cofactor-binding domain-containing protein [uncultured Amphritea sp.]